MVTVFQCSEVLHEACREGDDPECNPVAWMEDTCKLIDGCLSSAKRHEWATTGASQLHGDAVQNACEQKSLKLEWLKRTVVGLTIGDVNPDGMTAKPVAAAEQTETITDEESSTSKPKAKKATT